MPRYFIEVSYKGTRYSGFQVQQNAVTIQSEVEKALQTFFRKSFLLTYSSRTDAGVHALQNFFHFDIEEELWNPANYSSEDGENFKRLTYSLNSILPYDIVLHNITRVKDDLHARFNATSREYKYRIYQKKNPFYKDTAFYYPYNIDLKNLQQAADIILDTNDFTSFSKRNTQVKNFFCSIYKSKWNIEEDLIVYNITGNRFLRGMVRGVVATMLQVGRGKISLHQLAGIIQAKDCTKANFSVPPQGLFLVEVVFPEFLVN
ncbi:MAG: tRNA pseudouridine(38-40) synthase TruA [Ginsengibacter sp.]